LVAVKIRGLPYQVRYSEINDFFRQFRYIEKSSILGVGGDGRKNGYGSLLFESPEEAAAAAEELDQATIGTRYVELSVISYGDYLNFNGPTGGSGGGYGGGKTTRLSNYVSSDNEQRALVMRGLPYRIETPEI
jgi:RNA recognition motif-containing protein